MSSTKIRRPPRPSIFYYHQTRMVAPTLPFEWRHFLDEASKIKEKQKHFRSSITPCPLPKPKRVTWAVNPTPLRRMRTLDTRSPTLVLAPGRPVRRSLRLQGIAPHSDAPVSDSAHGTETGRPFRASSPCPRHPPCRRHKRCRCYPLGKLVLVKKQPKLLPPSRPRSPSFAPNSPPPTASELQVLLSEGDEAFAEISSPPHEPTRAVALWTPAYTAEPAHLLEFERDIVESIEIDEEPGDYFDDLQVVEEDEEAEDTDDDDNDEDEDDEAEDSDDSDSDSDDASSITSDDLPLRFPSGPLPTPPGNPLMYPPPNFMTSNW